MEPPESEKQRWHRFKAAYLDSHPVLAEELAGWEVMQQEASIRLKQINTEISRLRNLILAEYRRSQAR